MSINTIGGDNRVLNLRQDEAVLFLVTVAKDILVVIYPEPCKMYILWNRVVKLAIIFKKICRYIKYTGIRVIIAVNEYMNRFYKILFFYITQINNLFITYKTHHQWRIYLP